MMPDETAKTIPPEAPGPAADPVEKLIEDTPFNYDGQPPPGLPTPPGQEEAPAS